MKNTDEQTSILDFAKGDSANMMVNALAGTGKTSTLEQIDKTCRTTPVLYLVFNRRNADEATSRMASTTTVRTFNSLGHRIWQSAIGPRLRLDTKKTYLIFKEIADEVKGEAARAIWDSYDQVRFGVEMAKALGYVPESIHPNATRLISRNQLHNHLDEEPDDLVADLIDAVLKRSIQLSYSGTIDYNDQIYMSALFGGTYPKFPLTLVDEYQDLNPTNHEMIRKLVGNRRLIGVGDPNQNIYGFRGAAKSGMRQAVQTYGMTEFDLSISFRCPSAIVRNTHWHVPHFRWFKEGGTVEFLQSLSMESLPDSAVVLCRLNAPLFALGMRLLGAGRGVRIVGSDIGASLVKTMRKLGPEGTSQSQAYDLIEEWRQLKLAKESRTADDTADCMRVFVSHASTLGTACAYAEHIFSQRGSIQLSTGHKFKGLEATTIYHLNPKVIGDGPQDRNIRYVIQTRSSDYYAEFDLETVQ